MRALLARVRCVDLEVLFCAGSEALSCLPWVSYCKRGILGIFSFIEICKIVIHLKKRFLIMCGRVYLNVSVLGGQRHRITLDQELKQFQAA